MKGKKLKKYWNPISIRRYALLRLREEGYGRDVPLPDNPALMTLLNMEK